MTQYYEGGSDEAQKLIDAWKVTSKFRDSTARARADGLGETAVASSLDGAQSSENSDSSSDEESSDNSDSSMSE